MQMSAKRILERFSEKSDILSVGGQKIGLIGITPEDNHDLASPGKNIIFTAPAKAVQAEVDKLTKAGINKIILLSHSGFDIDLDIARQTTGIDVIVGGHSNTYLSNSSNRAKGAYPTMIGDTAIVQAYAYGKYLGELNVSFDDDGRLVSAIGEPLLLDKHVPEDEAILARLAVLAKPLDEIRNKVVAEYLRQLMATERSAVFRNAKWAIW